MGSDTDAFVGSMLLESAAPGLTLLLLGGPAALAGALAERCRPTGMVVWAPLGAEAAATPPGVRSVLADAFALPLLSHSIDVALSLPPFEATMNGGAGLAELRRVLAPRGRLHLVVPNAFGTVEMEAARRQLGEEGFVDYDFAPAIDVLGRVFNARVP